MKKQAKVQNLKSINDILLVGKYIGLSFKEVFKKDRSHITYLIDNKLIGSKSKKNFDEIQKYISENSHLNFPPLGFEGANSPDENWEDCKHINHF